ncbi:6,7-dimethyl-8-ribityllumazine synthase [Candidatus Nomurabacteria bacterium RIFCSPHIGHO2_02_FULL_37_13]|uniref:6,7-dimethyl-8-ribityllumazine synthase n=1 Tax=Candidatus Nomurabacteria bacterium RIFCSPHIGHO2_02_FULL_37_13 TaxID=1801750 RepID=A0A1F6W5H2_9BACT|nr:MAG: 6,7-dimethyl-8-ribityllumazine synthase [Candidatus Nomurabacteria bacterium RIFCSPHIGHO2_01_FULL_36_23]OGI77160.1 MAG: 6,7-dimethyl-8-ribityllumazine synthase [Candidatus Nomurabacteria bacterium RIFCSPHIGHO2_02_FULL_37_13]OGI88239.1 MAG: 6,7-dimethyl-8-ribityllumazine synthase [Candidatus Nomurabacteria bacterium RIFCSPLOWO2_01_FULL_37_25]
MQTKNKNKKYFDGSKLKAGIVVARWNGEITEKLLSDALVDLKKCKVKIKNIRIIHVSGAFEIPFALHKMALSKKYDFLVALGCIIRGDTPHFDYICKMAQGGVLKVMIEDNIPVGFGILTVNNLKQAKERIHVGGQATLAALELGLIK